MDYLQTDYGFVGELGYFFIPKSMQNESKIKSCQNGCFTLVKCEVENGSIVIKYHETIPENEHKERQKSNPKEIKTIDELGRVILLREHMKTLKISPSDMLKSHLVNNSTIVIRPFVFKESYELEAP
jgi:antitoxin component of MazEF toxin-antitoxin module